MGAQSQSETEHLKEQLRLKTRELEIEKSLEQVRTRALAMTRSSELSESSSVLFQQLKQLGIPVVRASVGIFDDPNGAVELWTTFSGHDEEVKMLSYVNLLVHPVLKKTITARKEEKPYSLTVLTGDEVKQFYDLISTYGDSQQVAFFPKEYFYSFFFSAGMLNVTSTQALTEEECQIMIRFAVVFGLIFTRFLDLQRSEENARNASREASLNRIRVAIATMRNRNDLEKITPLIWKELKELGVPFIRCGVFIMDDNQRLVHTFLSTPDGKAIAVNHLPYEMPFTLISEGVACWHRNELYAEDWDADAFNRFWDYVTKLGDQHSELQHKSEQAPEHLSLHLIPFLQGMLYVGNTFRLDNAFEVDVIDLLKSVAEAFSTAYSRYEDFIRLENAKLQVEMALNDLKLAQDQLVHAEKMASLGELTAGIAHEIQNPLNFVNNFSEVSKELLSEMKIELDLGNHAEARRLAESVIENLDKIHHHGKRADGIIKGMLQHSRSGSNQKELTDINALAEEYLRLTYHGLRAKDKSFNASFKTDFDPNAGKIKIIRQDIGRVILNLLTNAFYAVTERKAMIAPDSKYEPTVSISTKRVPAGIEIHVKDNGNGIPQKVLSKIFQPFFTTKPSGQGTGLGLSLSYDIITKGHGGEIRVDTNDGKGTDFLVHLPD